MVSEEDSQYATINLTKLETILRVIIYFFVVVGIIYGLFAHGQLLVP